MRLSLCSVCVSDRSLYAFVPFIKSEFLKLTLIVDDGSANQMTQDIVDIREILSSLWVGDDTKHVSAYCCGMVTLFT